MEGNDMFSAFDDALDPREVRQGAGQSKHAIIREEANIP